MRHHRLDDSDRVVWRGPLVNNPKWAWVDAARGCIATMGNECRYDLEHALVIYDQAGRVVRDVVVMTCKPPKPFGSPASVLT
jgi:hypothetical protein